MGYLDRIQPKAPPADPPHAIDVTADGAVKLDWGAGKVATISAHRLRDACPCAGCVEEMTGRKLLDSRSIPADIRPLQITPVGNYAIQIHWSDGHSTGIYTWETLRRVGG
jgi:DUF971 family protein